MRMSSAPLLPFELLGQIADYTDYSEIQSLRLVCKHYCSALEHRALSRLSLNWHTSPCGRTHHFPLEKVQAYTQPGKTPGIYHVRHLSIRNICMDLKYCDTPFDCLLRLPNYYDHDYMSKRETLRTQCFDDLVGQLFLGEGLRKVRTVTWHLGCSTHKSSGSTCVDTFNRICELLSSKRVAPLQRLELVMEQHASMYRLQNLGSVGFPPSKKLVVVDPETPYLSGASQWVRRLIMNQPSLEYVDIDLVYNENVFSTLFPNKRLSSSRHADSLPQHLSLVIALPWFHIEPHVFLHLRHLRSLSFVYTENYRPGTFETSFKVFWREMLSEQIFVEKLTYPVLGVEETFITYLAAYPKPTLKYLNLEHHLKRSEHLLGIFFTKAFPVIAPGLETLLTPACEDKGLWSNDSCLESLAPFTQCVSLQHLEIPLTLHPTHHGRIGPYLENVIHTVFKGHPHLKTVVVLAITNQWPPIRCTKHSITLMPDYQTHPIISPPAGESSKDTIRRIYDTSFYASRQ